MLSKLENRKAVIFIADAGAGHRMPALALKGALEKIYSHLEVIIFNVSTAIDREAKGSFLEKAYHFFNARFTWIYSLGFYLTNNPIAMHCLEWCFPYIRNNIVTILEKEKPDLLISMFPIINWNINRALKQLSLQIPKAIVVTDTVSVHQGWYYQKDFQLYVVGTQRAKNTLLWSGITSQQLVVHHPCLDEQYQGPPSEEAKQLYKQKWKIPSDSKVVLFAGGGEGYAGIELYVDFLISQQLLQGFHYLVVVGRNKQQYERVMALVENYPSHFTVFNFTNQMYQLMSMADLLLGKAGMSTSYQAFVLQKPLFLTHVIEGQETGTKRFICTQGVGTMLKTKKALGDLLRAYQKDTTTLQPYQQALQKLGMANGSEETARSIYALL